MPHAIHSWTLAATLVTTLLVIGRPALAQSADPQEEPRRLLREERFPEAVEAFARLARSNPYDGWAWGNWGYCLHMLKRYDEAIPCYQKAVDLGLAPASYLYNIACAHSLMGHRDEAFTWLERALDARFVEQETLLSDTDLDPLRAEPRFAWLTGITTRLAAPLVESRDEGWAWDLDFYARRMKQMHWDLFNKVPEPTFRGELARLRADVPQLSDDQVRARLRRITALVGDGHTSSGLSPLSAVKRPRLPLDLYAFKDGLYVRGASREHADLIGAKVLKVGALEVEAALAAVRPYVSVDNEMGYRDGAPAHLLVPVLLREIGAAADDSGVTFTLARGSGTAEVAIQPVEVPVRPSSMFDPSLVYPHQSLPELPLYLRSPERNLRLETEPERKLVYFWFGGVADDADTTVADFTKRLFQVIAEGKAEHLVIDMRSNGGGNTGLIRPLVTGLASCTAINRPGHLWVIIGRRTFSAAQNTVNLINAFTQATFVGEPTGSRPRFIGESTWFVLPHSDTRVYCSSRYWQVMDSTDQRCWVPPQIVAEPTYAD